MAGSLSRPLRLGTRGSPLALAQAHMVAEALCAAHVWDADAVEIVPITTSGDRIQDRPLAEVGGKMLWTKELDRCLLHGRTDLSVHSMKDVETIRPAELVVAAMLKRADPRDRIVGAASVEALSHEARVGTSSPRRRAQLLARRPDLDIVPIRGNVQTRLAKLDRGEADATLLAAAGLDRIGFGGIGSPLDDIIPAPSQGAIGVELLVGNCAVRALVEAIDCTGTHRCVAAERAFLAELGGDCRSAVAAHAKGGVLTAEILTPDGTEVQRGQDADPSELARALLARASPELRAMYAG
ncbi:MAG TPA: hydroxymethylbilane synthase [Allosphingosinicella sp.]